MLLIGIESIICYPHIGCIRVKWNGIMQLPYPAFLWLCLIKLNIGDK